MRGQPVAQFPCAEAAFGEFREEFVGCRPFPGYEDPAGAVGSGYVKARAPPAEQGFHFAASGDDRQQVAVSGLFGLGPAPHGCHPGGVREGQGTGHVGRGHLAEALAHHGGRLHAAGAPERRQRDHHREECGLDDVGGLQRWSAGNALEDVQ
ncbi:hypothetical protein STBA_68010 [Streptomyces sp. MP131-18]|nr:hypothetical protein STBA_68010 [Streptomyces sp. MP131-18]